MLHVRTVQKKTRRRLLLPVPRRCYNFIRTDSRDIETMLANLTTVQKWSKELDRLGEWLRWDESEGKVSRIFCALCTKYVDRLNASLVPRP